MKNAVDAKGDISSRLVDLVNGFARGRLDEHDRNVLFAELEETTLIDFNFRGTSTESISYEQIQKYLSSLNEKSEKRRDKGVFYTPHDLVNFITINLAKLLFDTLMPDNLKTLDFSEIPYDSFCFHKNVFDPTCGTGEFLLAVLDLKLDMALLQENSPTIEDVAQIVGTIYGNDIDPESIAIAKVRIVLHVLEKFGVETIVGLGKILKGNFTNVDYISDHARITGTFDMIVGNPPYVEDSKSDPKPSVKFGNVYANVLENSTKHLSSGGVMGYVIPLSYISTPRMSRIRDVLAKELPQQYILSYSDRPDCLFTLVHQKLNILLGKNDGKKILYTSNYQYWYRDERKELFKATEVMENPFEFPGFIPKLGSAEEMSLFLKSYYPENPVAGNYSNGGEKLYVNMRATFWIKAFLREHSGSEYKVFRFNSDEYFMMMCILNSSLFWWYWVTVSDCWHITNKELKSFRFPSSFDVDKARALAIKLEDRLEETKVFVGTKQVQYEYKHKACINEIHDIDDFIAEVYGLSLKEGNYVKNFNLRYRLGGGVQR